MHAGQPASEICIERIASARAYVGDRIMGATISDVHSSKSAENPERKIRY